MARAPLRIRLAKLLAGEKLKEFIPALTPFDGMDWSGDGRTLGSGTRYGYSWIALGIL